MEVLLTIKQSGFSVDQTVERIVNEAGNRMWRVPAVHDLQQTLAKSGKEVMPVKVIEMCKPELAGKILELNEERAVSVMMPCRISVFQKEDGKAYVSLLNVEAMAGAMPGPVAEAMLAAASESALIVDAALGGR